MDEARLERRQLLKITRDMAYNFPPRTFILLLIAITAFLRRGIATGCSCEMKVSPAPSSVRYVDRSNRGIMTHSNTPRLVKGYVVNSYVIFVWRHYVSDV